MSWKQYFSSSIGKKLQMGFTGLFLIVFLVVHAYINAQIWWGKEAFESAAHFMGTNIVIRLAEVGLFFFLLLHIFTGLALWFKNRSRRSVPYQVKAGSATSPWYRRSMGILGSLLLIFLMVHISKFWGPNRLSQTMGNGELDLYEMMREEFQVTWVVVFYLLGCVALAWHLVHGFYSAFQTMGLATHKYKRMINSLGIAFSIIIPLVFASMPLYFYLASIGMIELI